MKHFNKLFVAISLPISIVACTSNPKTIPINSMKKIVWDLQIANEYVLDLKTKDSTINVLKKTDSIFNVIMATHNTNKQSFLFNYNYYEKNPLLLNELLDSTANYGTKKRDTVVNKLVPTSLPIKK